ncbi:hypothetical protein ACFQPF_15645 [Fictibacillus iocasae]|uniref:Uncharacterized protein n=1 Tax=Fictibacillus iocasae TaxID=2715437 RepID=A0ABW2NYP3_9BACL
MRDLPIMKPAEGPVKETAKKYGGFLHSYDGSMNIEWKGSTYQIVTIYGPLQKKNFKKIVVMHPNGMIVQNRDRTIEILRIYHTFLCVHGSRKMIDALLHDEKIRTFKHLSEEYPRIADLIKPKLSDLVNAEQGRKDVDEFKRGFVLLSDINEAMIDLAVNIWPLYQEMIKKEKIYEENYIKLEEMVIEFYRLSMKRGVYILESMFTRDLVKVFLLTPDYTSVLSDTDKKMAKEIVSILNDVDLAQRDIIMTTPNFKNIENGIKILQSRYNEFPNFEAVQTMKNWALA